MARPPNIPQKFGSIDNNLLYEALYQIQRAIGQGAQQGRKNATTIQAANTVQIDNPVVRVLGTATIKTIKAPGFGTPIYFYAQDGFSFAAGGGNVRSDAVLGAGDSAIAQYDSAKDEWFIIGGGGPPLVGYITDGSNVGGGAEIFKSRVGTVLEHRTIKATGAATATQNADDVTINVPVPTPPPSISVGTDEIAYGDGSGGLTSQTPFKKRALNEGGLNVILADNYWSKRTPVINVKWFGATGNGSTDDTVAIQAAIEFAYEKGGTVYFPAGGYVIGKDDGTGLLHRPGVSYRGEGGCRSTGSRLEWRPQSGITPLDLDGIILNTTHVDISHATIEKLYFCKDPLLLPTAKVTGILGGCFTGPPSNPLDPLEYNSGSVLFRDLLFYKLEYGIRGNGAGYDPLGNRYIGFFDSVFDNIGYASCKYGVLTGGSGNVHIRPHFGGCTGGALVLDYISSESFSGENVYGGTWSQNKYDIYFYDGGGAGGGTSIFEQYRQTNLFGSWFEASTHGIVGYDPTLTGLAIIPVFNFQGCVLQTNAVAPTGYLLDLTKIYGMANVNECVVYKLDPTHNDQILTNPGTGANYVQIRDCLRWNWLGVLTKSGTDAGSMLIKAATAPGGFPLPTGVTVLVWDVVGATPLMQDFDREVCFDGVSTYTAKYSSTHRASVNVLLKDFPVGESIDLRISKNATVVAIFHQNGTGYPVSISLDTLVDMVVGDTLTVSVFNPDAAAKAQIVGLPAPYGFTNPHYNTFKVTREF